MTRLNIKIHILGCSAKQFWLLVRHGTRNPGDDDILDMQNRGKEIQNSIIKNHEEGRGKSRSDFPIDNEMHTHKTFC